MEATRKEIAVLRPKRSKRQPAGRPFLTEGAPTRDDLRPAGARLREKLDRPLGFGEVRTVPPSWALDEAAEKQLTGGFSRKANRYCGECGVLKTTRGVCFCDAPGPELMASRLRTEAPPKRACEKCGMRPAKGEPCICRK